MKKLLLIFYLLLTTVSTFANKVDELKTDSDVVKFLKPLQESFNYIGAPSLKIYSTEDIVKKSNCDSLVSTWHIKNWQKVDLNNDHRTDLLAIVNWYYIFCNYIAIDKGDNTFQLIQLGQSATDGCQLINAINYNNQELIELHGSYPKSSRDFLKKNKWLPNTDTLVYKYGNFVEFNKEPSNYKIDSITFSSLWGWFGHGNTPRKNPDYVDRVIEIDRSGNAVLTNNKDFVYYILAKGEKKPHDPGTVSGTFKTKLKNTDLEAIYHLINYLSIKKLNDVYAVRWSDATSSYIRIKFTDGSVKYIADYGGSGTFGLRDLFSKFYALIKNQDWK
ncbi:MAG: hypothetical protein V4560_09180 [Bacteroidota bacterium]